ncbi:MAG: hypothetical protein JSV80_02970, partial [Acidobacteriota bacterium]
MRQRREGLCEAFLTGEIDVPSWLAAHLPPGEEALSISRLEDRLAHSALKVRRVEPLPQESNVGHWSAKVLVDWPGE